MRLRGVLAAVTQGLHATLGLSCCDVWQQGCWGETGSWFGGPRQHGLTLISFMLLLH